MDWRSLYLQGKSFLDEKTKKPRAIAVRWLALPWKIFRVLCFVTGFAVIATLFAVGASVEGFLHSMPSVDKMTFADLQAVTVQRIQARATNPKYKHRWVPLKEVNRAYLYAVVLSEDATYFEHEGFNFDAIVDSLAVNLRERKPVFGGSTISQQVVKNLFLSNEKTLTRKLKEFLLTRSLEAHFGKNEILEIYFNIAEFGPELYGVGAAAWHFFGKSASHVNAAEGAFIALMLPSPKRHYFSIFENRNLTKQKRRRIQRVLQAMLYEELITDADYARFVHFRYFDPGRVPARSAR